MAHEALDGPCRRITQSTDCAAFDLFSVGEKTGGSINIFTLRELKSWIVRQLEQHVNLMGVPATLHHAVHHVHHPSRIPSAWRALATRFVLVELGEAGDGGHHICALVHDNNSTCTETRCASFKESNSMPKK